MTRLTARLFPCLAAALGMSVPLAAQDQPATFNLPPASPAPTPTPAGPADERAGVAIPPRAVPTATATPVIQPIPQPRPSPRASQPPLALPTSRPTPAVPASTPLPLPQASASAAPDAPIDPLALPTTLPEAAPAAPIAPATSAPADASPALPAWWPVAAGALGGLALLGGAALLWRRRKPKVLRLAAPVANTAAGVPAAADEPPRLDLALEITAATRSVMMFTVEYRLTIANRSDRAVNDARLAVQLACARASAGNAPSAGAAQALADVARLGPNQMRAVTGTVQLPLSAIAPLRQGQTPLFVPLVHVTLEGESLPATSKSFVIGTPSASGRVHPIPLDVPPGAINGLVAQAIAVPAVPAAA